MYHIQYKDPVTRESKMQDYDAKNPDRLLRHLAAFQYEIFNVFENGVMVTRREQQNLRRMADRGRLNLSSAALAFITNPL